MEDYMEHRLIGLHEAGTKSRLKEKVIIFTISLLTIVCLPFIHLGIFYYIWAPEKTKVNQGHCTCGCFDTVFRGRYEWPPAGYKHVYFNSTTNSMKIWLLTVLGVLLLYECLRYILSLYWTKRLRVPMVAVLVSAVYPHYYGWWGLFNYLNEDFYSQWNHQIFFSVTELLSTVMVVHLCNKDHRIQPWKLLFVIVINLMHIIVACLDQFIANIVYREAKGFEAVRDLALLMPDIFHVLLPFFELQSLARRQRQSLYRLFYKEELMLSVLVLILFSLLGKNL